MAEQKSLELKLELQSIPEGLSERRSVVPEPDPEKRFEEGFIDNILTERHEQREQAVIDRSLGTVEPGRFGRMARLLELSRDFQQLLEGELKKQPEEESAEPSSLRNAVNQTLGTLTGGIITLDAVDEHLQSEVLGIESPLSKKLKSFEGLRLLDPGGNLAESLARDTLTKQGTPPELIDKVAPIVGLVGAIVGTGGGTKALSSERARRIATEVYINSLFSGPQTQVSNALAQALVFPYLVAERTFAAGVDLARVAITGKHREVFFGEPAAMVFGAFSGIVDAVYAGLKTFVTGKSSFKSSILEDVATQARASEGRIFKELNEETVIKEGIEYWGTLWRAPTRSLGAVDEFSKVTLANMERYAMAYRMAAKSEDVSLKTIRARLKRPAPNVRKQIQDFAIINTFQRDLRDLPGFIGGVGRVGQKIQDVPMGRLFVPVVRTPVNLGHFTMERTPILGMAAKTFRDDLAAGGARASQAIAKQAAGATMFAAFVQFGASEIITGNGPSDPSLRLQKQELTGWQPCSLRIGNTYHSINRAEPVGSMLCLAADFADIAGSLSDRDATQLAQGIGMAITDDIIDGRFMTGALDVFDAIAGSERALERLAVGIVKRTTPAGGALRALTSTVDPIKRELRPGAPLEDPGMFRDARILTNLVISQTPGYSRNLPPRRNLWGEPIELPKGVTFGEISPVFKTIRKDDPASDEVVRLAEKGLLRLSRVGTHVLGEDPDSRPPDQPESPLRTGIELTDTEKSELEVLAGNGLKVDGRGLHEEVTRLVTKDKEFREASDAKRGLIIQATISAYRSAAVGKLLENNPGILEAFEGRLRLMEKAIEEKRR